MMTTDLCERIKSASTELAGEMFELCLGEEHLAEIGLDQVLVAAMPDLSTEGLGDDDDGSPELTRRQDELWRIHDEVATAMKPVFLGIVSQIISTATLNFLERDTDARIRAFFADGKPHYTLAELALAFGVSRKAVVRWVDMVAVDRNSNRVSRSEAVHGAAGRWGWRALTRALGEEFSRYYPARRAVAAALIQAPQFLLDELGDALIFDPELFPRCERRIPDDVRGRRDDGGERKVPGYAAAARYAGGEV